LVREKIEGWLRQSGVSPEREAALAGLAAFAGLYFAVVVTIHQIGMLWRYALIWGVNFAPRVTVPVLTAFAVFAVIVWRLRLKVLRIKGQGARVRELEGELVAAKEYQETLKTTVMEAVFAFEQANARAEKAEEQAEEARARALAAEMNARRAGAGKGGGGDEKFAAAKRAFARLYHPDNIRAEGLDKLIRAEIFKEYWRELEAIDKR
jgi:hypothetical protein